MDDRRFDELIRSLSLKLPRRSLGPLGAGLLAALGAPDADAKRRRDRDRDRDRDRTTADQERGADPRAGTGPEAAKKKRRKKKKPKPPTCGSFGAACISSYGCCGTLFCYGGRCAYSGVNPCPDDQYDCGATCSWSSTCCPTGQKLCDGVCVAQTACCPACGAGQTCVNGTCTGGGSTGCAVGEKLCDGSCVGEDFCCPVCRTDQVCNNGVCESLGCDATRLNACLDGIAQEIAFAGRPCVDTCQNPESDACAACMVDWLANDLDVASCYSAECDLGDPILVSSDVAVSARPENCESQRPDKCCKTNLDWCTAQADSQFSGNVLSEAAKKAAKALLGCAIGLACPAAIAMFARTILSSGGKAGAKYLAQLTFCTWAYGCGSNFGSNAACTRGNICCRRGQLSSADAPALCCWPGQIEGVPCGTSNGAICCGYSTCDPSKHLMCLNSVCTDTGSVTPDGRAEGDQCCRPQCTGKCGGDDGCGGTCPDTCSAQGKVCRLDQFSSAWSCICESGITHWDGACCPVGTESLCIDGCCDWTCVPRGDYNAPNTRCCAAEQRFTDEFGNKGCCGIGTRPRGDRCCVLAGYETSSYLFCCSPTPQPPAGDFVVCS